MFSPCLHYMRPVRRQLRIEWLHVIIWSCWRPLNTLQRNMSFLLISHQLNYLFCCLFLPTSVLCLHHEYSVREIYFRCSWRPRSTFLCGLHVFMPMPLQNTLAAQSVFSTLSPKVREKQEWRVPVTQSNTHRHSVTTPVGYYGTDARRRSAESEQWKRHTEAHLSAFAHVLTAWLDSCLQYSHPAGLLWWREWEQAQGSIVISAAFSLSCFSCTNTCMDMIPT